MELGHLWEQALPRLERRVGSQPFYIWIKPLSLLSVQSGSIIFEVPNVYYSDWIRDNYRQDILEVLQQICAKEKSDFGSFERLSFKVAGQSNATQRPVIADSNEPRNAPAPARTQSPLRSRQLNPQKNFESFVQRWAKNG